jgi:hypothetical protein
VKEMLSGIAYPVKIICPVPASSMRNNSGAYSGKNFEEMGKTNSGIRVFMLRHSSNQHQILDQPSG